MKYNPEMNDSDNLNITAGEAAVSGGQTRVVCDHVEEGGGHSDCDAPSDRPGDQCSVMWAKYRENI